MFDVGGLVNVMAATEGIEVSWWGLGLAALLVALNGFFVAAEFAMGASRRARLEQHAAAGNRRANIVLRGVREITLTRAGARLGSTMCSLCLGAVAEPSVSRLIEQVLGGLFTLSATTRHVIAFTIALAVVVVVHMVVGEMAPKGRVMAHPEHSALRVARPLRLFVTIFRPVVRATDHLAKLIVRMLGVEPREAEAMGYWPSDLLLMFEESVDHGGLAAQGHELLARSLKLSDLTAADAMTRRRDIVAVADDATAADVAAEAHRTGRTRVIVFEGDLDHVKGFVHAKDLLQLATGTWATTKAGSVTRAIMVTHEHHGLEDLLLEMRTRRQQISIVVNEHGTMRGLVTLEDVIEKLIGDFDDESDRHFSGCEELPDGRFRVAGTMQADDFEARTAIELPQGDWQTVAGYVIDVLDKIPAPGDRVRTLIGEFEVVAMDGYAIETLLICAAVRDETSPARRQGLPESTA